jgi:hypothetical protein
MSLRDVSVEQLKARAAGIYVTVHLDQELRVMSPKALLSVMIALLATSFSVKAEDKEPKAGQPYTEQLGDHQVTSVQRESTKGGDHSREELLKAAREAAPLNVFPSDPTTDKKLEEQR